MDGDAQTTNADKAEGKAVVISPIKTDETKTDGERNAVFDQLVREDGDIVGLVAYSIYKQNKVDWLNAFEKATGRAPNTGEVNAYIIGESTPRRLGTYRHLAGATLSGNGPDSDAEVPYTGVKAAGRESRGSWLVSSIISYAILAAAILAGIWIVARYALPASHG